MGSSKRRSSSQNSNTGCLGAMGGLCLAGMALALLVYLAFFLLALAIFAGLIALSVYFWKTEKINLGKKKRAIILAISWVVILSVSVGIVASTAQNSSPSSGVASSSVSSSSIAADSEAANSEASSDPAQSGEAASIPTSSGEQSASSASAAPVASPGQSGTESEEQAVIVWIPTHGGTKYHSKSTCSNMDDPEEVTLEEAKEMGFTPCGRCY